MTPGTPPIASADPPPPRRAPAGPRRHKRWTFPAIVALVLLWLTAMVFRMELRSRWWAYRLTCVESAEDRTFYLSRLASAGEPALAAVERLIADPRERVRLDAVFVLEHVPAERARHRLLDLLSDPADEVAWRSAVALADRDDAERAVPPLIAMLRDPSAAESAATALGRVAGPDAERALLDALKRTKDPDLRAAIIDALRIAAGRESLPDLKTMLDDRRPLTRPVPADRNLLRSLAGLAPQLAAAGVSPQALTDATPLPATVADVAARAVQLIEGQPLAPTSTRPAAAQP